MHLIGQLWAFGLPQIAMALAVAAALHVVTVRMLRRRCPRGWPRYVRVARRPSAAWCVGGLAAWFVATLAWMSTLTSSTAAIGLFLGVIVVAIASPFWHAQLFALGGAACGLGRTAMQRMLVAATFAGAATAIATPLVVGALHGASLLGDDGTAFPLILGTLPLGTAIAGLTISRFLPIDPRGPCCPTCGYDLSGLPSATGDKRTLPRCPECGYHPTAGPPPAG